MSRVLSPTHVYSFCVENITCIKLKGGSSHMTNRLVSHKKFISLPIIKMDGYLPPCAPPLAVPGKS